MVTDKPSFPPKSLKLWYWAVPGRAEAIRLTALLGNVHLEVRGYSDAPEATRMNWRHGMWKSTPYIPKHTTNMRPTHAVWAWLFAVSDTIWLPYRYCLVACIWIMVLLEAVTCRRMSTLWSAECIAESCNNTNQVGQQLNLTSSVIHPERHTMHQVFHIPHRSQVPYFSTCAVACLKKCTCTPTASVRLRSLDHTDRSCPS